MKLTGVLKPVISPILSLNHLQHSWNFLMYSQCWICLGPILRVAFTLAINLQCFPFNVSETLAKPLVSSHESLQTHTAGPFRVLVSQALKFFYPKKCFGKTIGLGWEDMAMWCELTHWTVSLKDCNLIGSSRFSWNSFFIHTSTCHGVCTTEDKPPCELINYTKPATLWTGQILWSPSIS